ncbi:hypothetical protein QFC21_006083 [Naganishia friedmannii]|uniref:Uncharacterized protein n=1 Tax=Naganishia friedmannii TaxID=89922 RepID=A0ACC2V5I5_9TREE|nr:hypothetical protein QFC21_006083 [Naganishia friedmannii]
MSERKAHSTTQAPAPLPVFSQAIESNGFLFTSGQIGATAEGTLVQGTIADRTTQALKNLDSVLKAAGSGLEHTVKLTVFVSPSELYFQLGHCLPPLTLDSSVFSQSQITDYSQFAVMNAAYLALMPSPAPARSCIGVKELPYGTDVEIEAVAVIPGSGRREGAKL